VTLASRVTLPVTPGLYAAITRAARAYNRDSWTTADRAVSAAVEAHAAPYLDASAAEVGRRVGVSGVGKTALELRCAVPIPPVVPDRARLVRREGSWRWAL
jgi:hypothetical protein